MKKQNLIAILGTVAIAANLLIPGLAFGQTDDQGGTLQIDCSDTTAIQFVNAPASVNFTTKSPDGVNYKDSFNDEGLSGANQFIGGNSEEGNIFTTQIDKDHLLRVDDKSSGGSENCFSAFKVTALMTSLDGNTQPAMLNDTGSLALRENVIPATNIHLITTDNVDLTAIHTGDVPTQATTTEVGPGQGVYFWKYAETGNDYDVIAPHKALEPTSLVDEADFTQTTNSLDSEREILGTCEDGSEGGVGAEVYAEVYTGVGLGIVDGIAPNQAPGTYTGTITYTFTNGSYLDPGNCAF